jgi:hypothetical protein
MGQIVFFSGHMIDRPSRPEPRFPAGKEPAAARAIWQALDAWNIGPGDLGICGGACGGDILFGEACLQRGAALAIYLPLPVADFIEASVRMPEEVDANWIGRFQELARQAKVIGPLASAGSDAANDVFRANNRRMIMAAKKAAGAEPLNVLLLWDGAPGDGPGGTYDIARMAQRWETRLSVIDPKTL